MTPAVIFSPHLDDAVLSAGQLMAGRPNTTIATVFSGVPRACHVLTDYDKQSGFENAALALTARRGEDQAAARVLCARTAWLDFADGQYREAANEAAIVDAMAATVERVAPNLLIGPLGLAHPDHLTTRRAYQRLVASTEIEAWVYEDLPSRVVWPEEVPGALDWWRSKGCDPQLGFIGTGPLERKQKAISCYASQLWALEPYEHCLLVPERFWRLW